MNADKHSNEQAAPGGAGGHDWQLVGISQKLLPGDVATPFVARLFTNAIIALLRRAEIETLNVCPVSGPDFVALMASVEFRGEALRELERIADELGCLPACQIGFFDALAQAWRGVYPSSDVDLDRVFTVENVNASMEMIRSETERLGMLSRRPRNE